MSLAGDSGALLSSLGFFTRAERLRPKLRNENRRRTSLMGLSAESAFLAASLSSGALTLTTKLFDLCFRVFFDFDVTLFPLVLIGSALLLSILSSDPLIISVSIRLSLIHKTVSSFHSTAHSSGTFSLDFKLVRFDHSHVCVCDSHSREFQCFLLSDCDNLFCPDVGDERKIYANGDNKITKNTNRSRRVVHESVARNSVRCCYVLFIFVYGPQ